MYFGRTEYIDEALSRGIIQWEGIARNVEYLGLSTDIKLFLAHWYTDWVRAQRGAAGLGQQCTTKEESSKRQPGSDVDMDESSSDGTDTDYYSGEEGIGKNTADAVAAAATAMDVDTSSRASTDGSSINELESGEQSRGRDRQIRCLSWTSPQCADDGHKDSE